MSAEGQQFGGKCRSFFTGGLNRNQILAQFAVALVLMQQTIRVTKHDHHQIVEVVRDAADQFAGAFKSLRMRQQFFRPLSLFDLRLHGEQCPL